MSSRADYFTNFWYTLIQFKIKCFDCISILFSLFFISMFSSYRKLKRYYNFFIQQNFPWTFIVLHSTQAVCLVFTEIRNSVWQKCSQENATNNSKLWFISLVLTVVNESLSDYHFYSFNPTGYSSCKLCQSLHLGMRKTSAWS